MLNSYKENIIIVGAGLAGCLLAIYLGRRGLSVKLFEKRPDMRSHEIPAGRSINLSLSARGIHALNEVELMPKIEPHLVAMPGRMLHRRSGELQFQPYGKNPSDLHYSVSRGALNKILLDAAEGSGNVSLYFDQDCQEIDSSAQTISFKSSTTESVRSMGFDTVIGTDGAGSAVCRALVKAGAIEFHHEPLAHGYKELTIPGDANGEHRIEKNALHIWPRGGYMLIALPNTDGSFTVTLFLPYQGPTSFASLSDESAVFEFFREQFPDAIQLIPNLVSEFFNNQTGELGTIRCSPWNAGGNLLILGDAAHAVVPFHGQGMNCAFEDCSEFNRCMDFYNDWEALFSAVDRNRRPNANAIADMALENYIEMRDSVRDPKFHLYKQIEWLLEERHPDRFIPRYSMVMFHRIPYAEVQRRGVIQSEILAELSCKAETFEDVDIDLADRQVCHKLEPIKNEPQ